MVLAVVNHKGGVGKTTFSLNLAATAADNGYTTCLIDLDPKGDLSKVLLDLRISDLTVFDLLCYSVPLMECLKATSMENLYIVPASNRVNEIVNSDGSYVLFSLREKINQYYKCDDVKLGQVEKILRVTKPNVFNNVIQRNPIIESALVSGQSLVTYSKDNPAALDGAIEYEKVFVELGRRAEKDIHYYKEIGF